MCDRLTFHRKERMKTVELAQGGLPTVLRRSVFPEGKGFQYPAEAFSEEYRKEPSENIMFDFISTLITTDDGKRALTKR